jgi:hypothetical protein
MLSSNFATGKNKYFFQKFSRSFEVNFDNDNHDRFIFFSPSISLMGSVYKYDIPTQVLDQVSYHDTTDFVQLQYDSENNWLKFITVYSKFKLLSFEFNIRSVSSTTSTDGYYEKVYLDPLDINLFGYDEDQNVYTIRYDQFKSNLLDVYFTRALYNNGYEAGDLNEEIRGSLEQFQNKSGFQHIRNCVKPNNLDIATNHHETAFESLYDENFNNALIRISSSLNSKFLVTVNVYALCVPKFGESINNIFT